MRKWPDMWVPILGGLMIGLVTAQWDWLPNLIFTILMLIAYAFLFRKRQETTNG